MISINLKDGSLNEKPIINPVVGIDLGTTNSLIAVMKNDVPYVILTDSGKNLMIPSVVYFDKDYQVIVGQKARKMAEIDPKNTLMSIKRLMGKTLNEIDDISVRDFQILESEVNGQLKVKVRDRYYSPVELSALILSELKTNAEIHLGQPFTKAVITVPAYFNDAQRQATRDAGKLAGLDVLRIINEPTAAALAYGVKNSKDQVIAVYDFGGGTFDISILRLEEDTFEVLATCGDTALGGNDIDQSIVDFWCKKNGCSINAELIELAIKAKHYCSGSKDFHTTIGGLTITLSYQEFQNICDPIIAKTLIFCKQALSDAKLNPQNIDRILLVGGSTRLPFVAPQLKNLFSDVPIDSSLDPDQTVAIGAAIQADVLSGSSDYLLMDIAPLSLGIETMGGLMDVILPRNSKVPARIARNYTTSVDGQKSIRISVFQGERDMVVNNRLLGEFTITGIPPMPAGLPKLEIAFHIDADGILKVMAKELRSEVIAETIIRSAYGISEEEMGNMLLESIKFAQFDKEMKSLVEARIEGEHVLHSLKKFLRDQIMILSQDEIKMVEQYILELPIIITSTDSSKINQTVERINIQTRPIAERALDYQIGLSLKGKDLVDIK